MEKSENTIYPKLQTSFAGGPSVLGQSPGQSPVEPSAPNPDILCSDPKENQFRFRLDHSKRYQHELEQQLSKYKSLLNKHKKVSNGCSYVSISSGGLGTSTGVAAVTTASTGVGAPAAIPLGAIAIGSGIICLTTSALEKKFKTKIMKYEKLSQLTKDTIDLISRIISDAILDEVITDQEFKIIVRTYEKYSKEINQIKNKIKEDMQQIEMDDLKNQILHISKKIQRN